MTENQWNKKNIVFYAMALHETLLKKGYNTPIVKILSGNVINMDKNKHQSISEEANSFYDVIDFGFKIKIEQEEAQAKKDANYKKRCEEHDKQIEEEYGK
jgi:hypothetical protein